MNKLPSSPIILLSIINTELRDFYSSLDQLCDDLDKCEIIFLLENNGYFYNEKLNQFIKK